MTNVLSLPSSGPGINENIADKFFLVPNVKN